jgi:hypothetical protein
MMAFSAFASQRIKGAPTRIIVNSKYKDADSKSVGDMFYTLHRKIDNVKKIEIMSLQVPFTFYAFTALNNIIQITTGQAAIPPGNYNATTLAAQLETTMDAIGGGAFTVTYSQSTHKYTITTTGAAFQILTTASNNIANEIGFTTDSTLATSATADSVVNTNGARYLELRSSALTKYSGSTTITSVLAPKTGNTVLYTIPVKGLPTDIIIDERCDSMIELNKKQTFHEDIDFQLEDDSGNTLDLNGQDYSFQLVFHTE